MTTGTRERTEGGFDLVMMPEAGGWLCSVYRTGKQVPMYRKMVDTEAQAEKFFAASLRKEAAR